MSERRLTSGVQKWVDEGLLSLEAAIEVDEMLDLLIESVKSGAIDLRVAERVIWGMAEDMAEAQCSARDEHESVA